MNITDIGNWLNLYANSLNNATQGAAPADAARFASLIAAAKARMQEAQLLLAMAADQQPPDFLPLTRNLAIQLSIVSDSAAAQIETIDVSEEDVGVEEFEAMLDRRDQAAEMMMEFEIAGVCALLHLNSALALVAPVDSTTGTEDHRE